MTPFVPADWLPVIFAVLMAVSIFNYVVLDGFDLGVGILLPRMADEPHRDRMIAAIGPFWDANETWLVLGVGLLLVAFPSAHGVILTALYLPVALMLVALMLRGVAFEFRAKAITARRKRHWDHAFVTGSLVASLSQGWMLGRYVLGFSEAWHAYAFAAMAALGLPVAYAFIGAAWLIWRTEGDLQRAAIGWARMAVWPLGIGILLVSAVTPLVSSRIFDRWFSFPEILFLAPLPVLTLLLLVGLSRLLARMPLVDDARRRMPFWGGVGLFALFFAGLAWSFFPYVVPERLTIWQAASAPESLSIILIGVIVVLPTIFAYTALAWRVFRGKARELSYY